MSWFDDNWQSLVSGGTGLIGSIGGLVEGQQNLKLQKDNLAYQKELQQKLFDREDSAMQRRVADLRAAGLNPVLASGSSGAGAGQSVSTTAPQGDSFSRALAGLQLSQLSADIGKTKAETALIDKQAETEGTKPTLNQSIIEMNKARTALTEADVKVSEMKYLQGEATVENLRASTEYLSARTGLASVQSQQILKSIDYVNSQIVHLDTETKHIVDKHTMDMDLLSAQIAHLKTQDSLLSSQELLTLAQKEIENQKASYFAQTGQYPSSANAPFLGYGSWFAWNMAETGRYIEHGIQDSLGRLKFPKTKTGVVKKPRYGYLGLNSLDDYFY